MRILYDSEGGITDVHAESCSVLVCLVILFLSISCSLQDDVFVDYSSLTCLYASKCHCKGFYCLELHIMHAIST